MGDERLEVKGEEEMEAVDVAAVKLRMPETRCGPALIDRSATQSIRGPFKPAGMGGGCT